VPDEDDARRLPAVRYVSPEIDWAVTDGDGVTWDGPSITHIAATARPVQKHQLPFQFSQERRALRLSLEDYDMPEVKEKPDRKEGNGSQGAAGEFKDLVEALKGAGLNIPEEVEDLCGLIIAVKASSGTAEVGGEGGGEAGGGELAGGGGLTEAPAPPIAMSALAGRVYDLERRRLAERVEALERSGRVPRAVKEQLLSSLATVRLSLGGQAQLRPNALLAKVEAYEALPEGPFARKAVQMGGLRVAPHPELDGADELREAARKEAQRVSGSGGGKR
jgi:hypothetical protein